MSDSPAKARRPKKVNLLHEAIDAFCPIAFRKGMPVDQIQNFVKFQMWLQPKQMEMAAAARECDHWCPECAAKIERGDRPVKDCPRCGPRAIGVGGARGGGKSQWMVAQVAVDDCQRFPGLDFLYVRKSAKTLRAQMSKLLRKTLPDPKMYNYREQVGEVLFPNGSKITIRHFKDESEIDNFLGEEYDGIAYEELTTLSSDKFTNLNTCLRTSKKGWRPRIYASWNWGGTGHSWVKRFFYDPWKHKRQTTTRYILALVQDNKHIDPGYQSSLEDLRGWKYQSWFLGNPDLAAGNYFKHYREDIHVYPCDCPDSNCKCEATYVHRRGIVKCSRCGFEFPAMTFQDEDAVRWWGSLDYGTSMPNCFHLFAENADGDCFTVGEVHTMEQGISENCEQFKDLCRMHNIEVGDLEAIFAGQDVLRGDRKTREDGSTAMTEFEENGITLTPLAVHRVEDFGQMQERFGDPERGIRPTWFIHKSCGNLRSQIQTAQCDPKKPNDVLKQNADSETGEGGSDALESGRNGICGAYNTVMKSAAPIRLGAYQPLVGNGAETDGWRPVEAVILEAERNEEERRAGLL